MMMNAVGQQLKRVSTARDAACSVFISQSKDIFSNLALEDWLYRNFSFENHRVLLLWRNTPCVVIGRHQNPWIEANVDFLRNEGIALARRNSGGGAVYHDMGNLNCTFFTSRSSYNRKQNLQLIAHALKDTIGVGVELNDREDLTLNEKKISGTAAKLGKNAYHHCTLLVDADKTRLSRALNVDTSNYTTNATGSVKSSVTSLKSAMSSLTVEDVMEAIGDRYFHGFDSKKIRGYSLINPTEGWFPGIRDLKKVLRSWEWNFGKTPRFCVCHEVSVSPQVSSSSDTSETLKVKISVINGVMSKLEIEGSSKLMTNLNPLSLEAVRALQGQRYCCNMTSLIQDRLLAGATAGQTVSSAAICGEEQALVTDNLDDSILSNTEDDMKLYLKI